MKKLFVLVGCISQILFSCHKNHDPNVTPLQKPGLITPASKGVSLKVTDIYSSLSAIKRRIDVINNRTNTVLGKMFITLSCNDPKDDLYRKINYEPEKFSGLITLESSHLLRFTKKILNGKLVEVEKVVRKDIAADSKTGFEPGTNPEPISTTSPNPGSSTDGFPPIHACAETYLDNMSWQDIANCFLKYSFCFTGLVGICLLKWFNPG